MARVVWLFLASLLVSVPAYLLLAVVPSQDRAAAPHTIASSTISQGKHATTPQYAAALDPVQNKAAPPRMKSPGAGGTTALPVRPPHLMLVAGDLGHAVQDALAGSALHARPARTRPSRAGNASPLHARASRSGQNAITLLHLPRVLPTTVMRLPILMYHFISPVPTTTALNYGLTVTDDNFVAQLTYLRDHGYHTVGVRQVFDAFYHHGALPSNPIVLSFDDGYLDNYTDALPILLRFHDHAEFNIISAFVGLTVGINSYMTWPQLRQLVAHGMDIGSHTVDHRDLGLLTEDQVRFELRDSRNTLQQQLHVPVQWLAYPSGSPFLTGSVQAQQLVLSLMPQYGYVGALLDDPRNTAVQHANTPFQLERIRVAGGEDLTQFAASLTR